MITNRREANKRQNKEKKWYPLHYASEWFINCHGANNETETNR